MGVSKRAGDDAMVMFDIGISQDQSNLRLPAVLVLNEFFSHNHTLLLSVFRSVLRSRRLGN